MAKRDDHTISINTVSATCPECGKTLGRGTENEPHLNGLGFYCADCCPLCREREAAR